ncbi:tRNA lysidine(34) synthetase TilS [Lonepinella sp. BR2271]|uniref:tRNA lysidine(34) synthetase TilS n=1 Tax=Lonepinella sp. BR2271 TaxID=3434550 RepID=UPI003F6E058F
MRLVTEFQSQLQHTHYLIALSGGLDSTALVSLMAKAREKQPHLQLRAVHIHHGLHPHADHWVSHCEQLCQQFAIPLLVKKVQVDHTNGLEQGAREARYQAIADSRLPNEIVVTAHHLQDQAETFFLALKRGSGVQGLGAMPPYAALNGMPIFRPLLTSSRQQLEHYVQAEKLTWVEDDSNADLRYDRNFLRHQVLPTLRQRWPHFDQMVARSAQHCAEQQQLIHQLLAEDFQHHFDPHQGTLSIVQWSEYPALKQNALLRMWLAALHHPMPSVVQLAHIKKEVIAARADAMPHYVLGNKVIRRYQQRLYLTDHLADISHFQQPLSPELRLKLPDNLGALWLEKNPDFFTAVWQQANQLHHLDLPFTALPIWVKFAYSGSVQLVGQKMRRDIKKIWQQFNVPVWQRQRIPLIFYGDKLQGAVGLFRAD